MMLKQTYHEYRLKDITTKIGSGATPKGGHESYKEEGTPLIRSLNVYDDGFRKSGLAYLDDFQAKKLSNVTVKENDILLNITGASVARCCIVPSNIVPARVNQHVSIIRVKPDLVDPKFLSVLLTSKTYKDLLLHHGEAGSTRQAITKLQLEEFIVSLPPLPEQKRIVAILDEAFANISQAVANAEKNLANARELFDSYLNEVFTRKGEGWEGSVLSNICEVKDGTHYSPKYIKQGIPFVTQKNVRDEGLNFDNVQFISEEDHNNFFKRSNVERGDILISMIGINRGMSCLVDDDRIFSIKNVGLIKNSEKINMDFLLFYLKSRKAKAYVDISSNGGAQPFIGLTKLRSFPIFIAPKSSQDKIVDELNITQSKTRDLERIYSKKLAALAELKQTLLQKAFTGELTA